MFMNKDQNLINEFAIKTLKENLNVMYAQIWREGQLTAEYKSENPPEYLVCMQGCCVLCGRNRT